MKTNPKLTFLLVVALFGLLPQSSYAQKVISLTLNVMSSPTDKAFLMQNVANGNHAFSINDSRNMSLNARFFRPSGIAMRVGAGVSKEDFTIVGADSSGGNYGALRKDYNALLGVEAHIRFPGENQRVSIYPGLYVPIIYHGTTSLKNNAGDLVKNYRAGDIRSGLGAVLGFNVKLLKFIRIGLEADAQYNQVIKNVTQLLDQDYIPKSEIKGRVFYTFAVAF